MSCIGFFPNFIYTVYSVCHTQYGTHCRTIAIRVKPGFNRHTDGFSEITLTVKQGDGNNHRIRYGMAPVMRGIFIITVMDGRKTIFGGHAVSKSVKTSVMASYSLEV